MGGLSFWHIMIVAVLFILLFGRGRISDIMGDVAKGIKSFKKGLQDEDEAPARPESPRSIAQDSDAKTGSAGAGDKAKAPHGEGDANRH